MSIYTKKSFSSWPGHRVHFLTICTHERQPTLGHIEKTGSTWTWNPTPWGTAATEALQQLKENSTSVMIYEYAVMPNHVHLLVLYKRCNERLVSWFISHCKHVMTQRMQKASPCPADDPIWERSYSGYYIRCERTQRALCQNLQEHQNFWYYDSLFVQEPKKHDPK